MQATFQCNSTIQLWLTPKRDMSVFFCWVYLIVNGSINLSGLLSVHITSWSEWQYMQWCIIGLIIIMLIMVMSMFRNFSTMPKIPFIGIDWLGMIMWGASAICVLFICVYGEPYDWFESDYIWFASIACVVITALNCWRASFIRHPYIWLSTFKHPIVWICPAIYILADFLLAPEHVCEHILMENILGYDSINLISLNWVSFVGSIASVIFTWRVFAVKKWSYQTMLTIGFGCIALYLAYFYFMIDYNIPKETLMLPIFIRNFGYVMIAISVLTANTRMPFPFKFFQGVTIQNVFSASLAGAMGSALLGRILKIIMAKNYTFLSSNIDSTNNIVSHFSQGQLYGIVQMQALMVSMKEIYGYLLIISFVSIIVLLLRRSDFSRPIQVIHPKFKTLRKQIKHELRMDRKTE